MDWLTFIASMTGHLAWPVMVGLAIWIFRKSIVERLPYLTKASWGDKSLEFSDRLGEAAEKAVELAPPEELKALPAPTAKTDEEEKGEEQFTNALQASPRFAVLQAWIPVEHELQRVARLKGYSADRTRSPTYTVRQLQNDGTLSGSTVSLLKDLLSLRNIAAHGGPETEISQSQAIEYRAIADVILDALRAMEG